MTEANRIDFQNGTAFKSRGLALSKNKKYTESIADYTEAIRIQPGGADAYNDRAWIWATCPDEKYRDGKQAVASATKACELTEWKDANCLGTLAAACAEVGDFASAVKWQTKANELRSNPDEKTEGEAHLKLYQENKPYRDAGI